MTKAIEHSYMIKMNVPLLWHFDGLLTSFLSGPLFYNSLPPGIYESIQDGLRRHLPGHFHQTLLKSPCSSRPPNWTEPKTSPSSPFPFGPLAFSGNTHISMSWQTPAHPSEADCPWLLCLVSQPLSHSPVHSPFSLPPVWVRTSSPLCLPTAGKNISQVFRWPHWHLP